MLVAAGSAFSQCHLNSKERNPLSSDALQRRVAGHHRAGHRPRVPPARRRRARADVADGAGASAGRRPRPSYFLVNTGLVATAIALSTRTPILSDLAQQLPVERAQLLRRRRHRGARGLVRRATPATGWRRSPSRRSISTYRTYKVYMGRIEDEQRHVQQTSDLHLATIEALARAIDAKDQTTQMHIRARAGVRRRTREGAGADGSARSRASRPRALLHDIGKLAVPEHILSKPGPLTQEEFQKIRIHPQVGAGDHRRRAVPVSGRAADPEPPRAVGRQGLSAGARRRGHPDRRAHPHDRRLLRRGDDRAPVSQGAQQRQRASGCCGTSRARARSEAGAAVHRDAAGAGRRARPRASRRSSSGRTGADAARIHRRSGLVPAGVPNAFENIALAHREIYALYEIAQSMGTSLGVVRHDGADLVEAVEDRAVVGLRALPAAARERLAQVPLRGRRRRAEAPERDAAVRARLVGLGGAQPPHDHQRATRASASKPPA